MVMGACMVDVSLSHSSTRQMHRLQPSSRAWLRKQKGFSPQQKRFCQRAVCSVVVGWVGERETDGEKRNGRVVWEERRMVERMGVMTRPRRRRRVVKRGQNGGGL